MFFHVYSDCLLGASSWQATNSRDGKATSRSLEASEKHRNFDHLVSSLPSRGQHCGLQDIALCLGVWPPDVAHGTSSNTCHQYQLDAN
ncbi:hypothetical protein TIFTF001_023570 [Ficus carica]|uniref:Uncharacterized protein n=1 Tax=Ficus carica TaxID=3494 RepID=A0AA88ALZ1_FICCA|nr:hypothetical protein TIFTF001_023570 [Ficus carica]